MKAGNNGIKDEQQSSTEFEQLYIQLRRQENRIYTDEEVAWLPEIAGDHIHKGEWAIRKRSCKKLVRYLRHKNKALKILEVGCGNGWLSYQLSQIPNSTVSGLDVNLPELLQAERVFTGLPNLDFIHGDLNSSLLNNRRFDVIVFAASIQYFNSFSHTIATALEFLGEKGEIHIIDSHFYSEEERSAAEQRSYEYFHSRGFDTMHNFYFHHALKELEGYHYTILYDPNAALNKILNRKIPFYWIRIKK